MVLGLVLLVLTLVLVVIVHSVLLVLVQGYGTRESKMKQNETGGMSDERTERVNVKRENGTNKCQTRKRKE